MRDLVLKYFGESEVIPYHEKPELKWEEAKEGCPQLSKGWFELSKLDSSIRLEFIRDYWINSLPYFPHLYAFLDRFFSQVEEVGIIGIKGNVYMTYVLKSAFFIGGLPLVDQEIEAVEGKFDFHLPPDYLQFFRVHNGFAKGGDTGLFPLDVLIDEAEKVQSSSIKCGTQQIDPRELFPFYYSLSLDTYQCFYEGFVVDGEMGNVLCSLAKGTISDFQTPNKGETFSNFLDWLISYMALE